MRSFQFCFVNREDAMYQESVEPAMKEVAMTMVAVASSPSINRAASAKPVAMLISDNFLKYPKRLSVMKSRVLNVAKAK